MAPGGAGPRLADADPRRVGAVLLRLAIPGEPNFYAPKLLGVDLLARRAGDERDLRSDDSRPRDRAVRRRRGRRGHRGEGVVVGGAARRRRLIGLVVRDMADREQHLLRERVGRVRHVLRREALARRQRAHGGGGGDRLVAGLGRLDAVFHRLLGGGRIGKEAGELVALGGGAAGHDVERGLVALGRAHGKKVPVAAAALAGGEGEAAPPRADVVLRRRAERVAHLRLRAIAVAGDMVGNDERVLALLVLEPVEQAVLLHAAQHVVEVGLVPLHGVFLRRGRAGDAQVEIADAVLLAELLDDRLAREVLELAAVRRLAQRPQLRAYGEAVRARPSRRERALVQVGDEAVPPAGAVVLQLEADIDAGADEVGGLQVVALRLDGRLDREEAVETLVDGEVLEQQDVMAERRRNRHHPAGLGVGHALRRHLATSRNKTLDQHGQSTRSRAARNRDELTAGTTTLG
ncbi:hypothetical protein RHCH11_RHCH11_00921 [Beijerinckiaceae bacterium RH CH11]|nr:hypothetical protein RHCH11_RHCH11_00921 [Beijerinckiaceae bacterium RH CH11]